MRYAVAGVDEEDWTTKFLVRWDNVVTPILFSDVSKAHAFGDIDSASRAMNMLRASKPSLGVHIVGLLNVDGLDAQLAADKLQDKAKRLESETKRLRISNKSIVEYSNITKQALDDMTLEMRELEVRFAQHSDAKKSAAKIAELEQKIANIGAECRELQPLRGLRNNYIKLMESYDKLRAENESLKANAGVGP